MKWTENELHREARCTKAKFEIKVNREANIKGGVTSNISLEFPGFQHFAMKHTFAHAPISIVINQV